MEVKFDPVVLDVLADGYNVHYGARSIKHEVGYLGQFALLYNAACSALHGLHSLRCWVVLLAMLCTGWTAYGAEWCCLLCFARAGQLTVLSGAAYYALHGLDSLRCWVVLLALLCTKTHSLIYGPWGLIVIKVQRAAKFCYLRPRHCAGWDAPFFQNSLRRKFPPLIITLLFTVGQVERRVVNQLALAHESGVLCPGCSVLVTAALPSSPTEKALTLTAAPTPIILKVKKQQDTEFTEVDPSMHLKSWYFVWLNIYIYIFLILASAYLTYIYIFKYSRHRELCVWAIVEQCCSG